MSHQPSTIKVVLIDDASFILGRLETILSPLENVDVLGSARTVADGMAVIERLRPDAIVLDLQLPDGSGTEILERVKRDTDAGADSSKGTPVVIVLTAHPSPQVREKCLTLGADYFFDKALEFQRVTHVLNALANNTETNGRQSTASLTGCGKLPNPGADGTDDKI